MERVKYVLGERAAREFGGYGKAKIPKRARKILSKYDETDLRNIINASGGVPPL